LSAAGRNSALCHLRLLKRCARGCGSGISLRLGARGGCQVPSLQRRNGSAEPLPARQLGALRGIQRRAHAARVFCLQRLHGSELAPQRAEQQRALRSLRCISTTRLSSAAARSAGAVAFERQAMQSLQQCGGGSCAPQRAPHRVARR
jgi:hypothetical protein